jgi:hypothetical protein
VKLKIAAILTGSLLGIASASAAHAAPAACDRTCMSGMVDTLLASMVAHDPDSLPLAAVYEATENSHPAALGMMEAWRTITRAGKPSLLAIDTDRGVAYFALTVDESGSPSVLWGRIGVENRKIDAVEIFINRSRGDHGFSFSAKQLPGNYRKIMTPPADRVKASHAELERLARAAFDASDPLQVKIADDCQFTELGWKVVDPGLDDVPPPAATGQGARNPLAPLGCVFPPYRPTDKNARVIAIDDDLGLVVVAGVVPGHVFPYPYFGHMLSAFIPDDMKAPQKAQDDWMERHLNKHGAPIVRPEPATGETMQVLQFYNGKLEASQINVYLSGPGMSSVWRKF